MEFINDLVLLKIWFVTKVFYLYNDYLKFYLIIKKIYLRSTTMH